MRAQPSDKSESIRRLNERAKDKGRQKNTKRGRVKRTGRKLFSATFG